MAANSRFNEQKATEAATLLLHMHGGSSDYWWIIKMLYLIDREAFKRWERPITYDFYESLRYGPVLMTVYNIIVKNFPSTFWKRYIVTRGKDKMVQLNGSPARIRKLSRAEVGLINELFEEFGGLGGDELVDYTHTLPEWRDPHGSRIPIELPDLLKVLNYSQEDIKRISSELKAEESLDMLLGA